MGSLIYLDYAATTPLDTRVLAAMGPYLTDNFYNPSAAYSAGRSVKKDIEAARQTIAAILGAKSAEIIFTAGATESINLGVFGITHNYPNSKVITSAIEHPAVLKSVKQAGNHTIIPVSHTGQVNINQLAKAIDDNTVLISIGYVNSELGTIQPLKEISALIKTVRKQRARSNIDLPLYFHSDASQAVGHLDLHVSRLGLDMMSLNAGKAYGPKQVGLLYLKADVSLKSLIVGGGQESDKRSGTENVAGIIGMAKAFELAEADREIETRRLQALRQKAVAVFQRNLPEAVINGEPRRISPHILNISIKGVDGERLLMELDEAGVQVATGSACAANYDTRSHVLTAVGLDDDLITGSLRLSFGRPTLESELDTALNLIIKLAHKLRELQNA